MGSAWRWTSFHAPSSRRKVLVTRSSKDVGPGRPATFALHRSTAPIVARFAVRYSATVVTSVGAHLETAPPHGPERVRRPANHARSGRRGSPKSHRPDGKRGSWLARGRLSRRRRAPNGTPALPPPAPSPTFLLRVRTPTRRGNALSDRPQRAWRLPVGRLTPKFSCKRVNKSAWRSHAQPLDRLSAATPRGVAFWSSSDEPTLRSRTLPRSST